MKQPVAILRSASRNLPFFREELNALVGNASLLVKCVCIIVVCSYLISYYAPAIEVLSVIPGHLLPPSFRIWTLFTHPFLEIHLWEVVVDIITVGLCGKLIEPLWGSREMFVFFGIVNVAVVIFCVSYYLFLYAITFDPTILFEVRIHGLSGYIAAVSVSVRQIMPDHVLVRTPIGKITNRNVPLSVLLFSIVLWAIGLLEGTFCTMFTAGILSSWVYLRFYQRHNNGTCGDTTDFFTFASFFPNVLQPPVSVMSNSIFTMFRKAGCFKNRVKTFADASSAPSSIQINISHQSDADRRKQKALRLLNERLGIKKSEATVPLLHSESRDEDVPTSISIPAESSSSSGMHRSHSAGSNLVTSVSINPVYGQSHSARPPGTSLL